MRSPCNSLAGGPPSTTKLDIFVSHSWDNERRAEIHTLIGNSGWKKGPDFQDHSITWKHPIHETHPRLLLKSISKIIGRCDVLLVPAGMEGPQSGWMDREIYAACILDIPIIAVIPHAAQRRWIFAREMADEEVSWRGQSIRDAILKWTQPAKRDAFLAKLRARPAAIDVRRLNVSSVRSQGFGGLGSPLAGVRPAPASPRTNAFNILSDSVLAGRWLEDAILGRKPK
jgi:hypothetical protein